MRAREKAPSEWRILSTPPLSGIANMLQDAETLASVERREAAPTLRLFRFKEPTMSFGKLQKHDGVRPLLPEGWALVQRPTGGGVVFHDGDLCLSLCWHDGQAPLPQRPQEQYHWIHSVIMEVLRREAREGLRMAGCHDGPATQEPFAVRACFRNPAGYDLLDGPTKIVGGALRRTRQATLYQGSIQIPIASASEARLQTAFERRLK